VSNCVSWDQAQQVRHLDGGNAFFARSMAIAATKSSALERVQAHYLRHQIRLLAFGRQALRARRTEELG